MPTLALEQKKEIIGLLYSAQVEDAIGQRIVSLSSYQQAQQKIRSYGQECEIPEEIITYRDQVREKVCSPFRLHSALTYARNAISYPEGALRWLEDARYCAEEGSLTFPKQEYEEIMREAILKGIPFVLSLGQVERARELERIAKEHEIELPESIHKLFQWIPYISSRLCGAFKRVLSF